MLLDVLPCIEVCCGARSCFRRIDGGSAGFDARNFSSGKQGGKRGGGPARPGQGRTLVSDLKAQGKSKKAERGEARRGQVSRLLQRKIALLKRPHDGSIQQINCNKCEVAIDQRAGAWALACYLREWANSLLRQLIASVMWDLILLSR